MELRPRNNKNGIDPTQQLEQTQQLLQTDLTSQSRGAAMNGGISTQDLASIIDRNSCARNWSGADEILGESQTQANDA